MANEQLSQSEQLVQLQIAQIIDRSRHHEELFLVDSKTAASHIISFLKNQNLITYADIRN